MSATRRTATVIVTSASEAAAEVRLGLSGLVRSGQAHPALLVSVGDVGSDSEGVPRITGAVAGSDGTVDIFDVLSQNRFDLVRLLLLRDAEADEDELEAAAAAVARALDLARPIDRAAASDGPSKLLALRVTAPTSGSAGTWRAPVPGEPWAADLLLSPEDSAFPDGIADFVRLDGRYAGHSAAALATAGGLWRSCPIGAFDSFAEEGPGPAAPEEPGAIPFRSQARVVTMHSPLQPVVNHLVRVARGEEPYPESVAAPILTAGHDASQGLVQLSLKRLRKQPNSILEWQEQGEVEEGPSKQIGWAQLTAGYRAFLLPPALRGTGSDPFVGQRFPGALVEPITAVWNWLRATTDQTVHDTFEGSGTGRHFRERPTLPEEIAASFRKAVQDQREEATPATSEEKRDSSYPFWAPLRRETLGLADGERIGHQAPPRPVVSDRSMIAPVPHGPTVHLDVREFLGMEPADPEAFDYWTRSAEVLRMKEALEQLGSAGGPSGKPAKDEEEDEGGARSGRIRRALTRTAGLLVGVGAGAAAIANRETAPLWLVVALAVLGLLGVVVALTGRTGIGGLVRRWRERRAARADRDPLADQEEPGDGGPKSRAIGSSHPAASLRGRQLDAEQYHEDPVLQANLAADLENSQTWLARLDESFLGRINRELGQITDRCNHEYRRIDAKLRSLERQDDSDLRKRRSRWLLTAWITIFAVPAAIYAFAVQRYGTEPLASLLARGAPTTGDELLATTLITGIVLGVILLVAARSVIRYYKATRRYMRTLQSAESEHGRLIGRWAYLRARRSRADSARTGLARWSEALAWLVQNPYPPTPELSPGVSQFEEADQGEPGPTVGPLQGSARPHALRIAAPHRDEDFEQSERRRVAAAVLPPGWLQDLLTDVVALVFDGEGIDPGEILHQMDSTATAEQTPLAPLLANLRGGAAGRPMQARFTEKVAEARISLGGRGGGLGSLACHGERVAPGTTVDQLLSELNRPAAALTSTWMTTGGMTGADFTVAQSVLWSNQTSIEPAAGVEFHHVAAEADPDIVQVVSVRCDVGHPAPASSFRCFADDAAHTHDGDSAQPGAGRAAQQPRDGSSQPGPAAEGTGQTLERSDTEEFLARLESGLV